MSRHKYFFMALVFFLIGCCPYNGIGFKYVKLRPQETSKWCWAATTQMGMETLGEFIEQCEMANLRFSRNDCCTTGCPKNPSCSMPGWTMFSEFGYTFGSSVTPLSWQLIKDQICSTKKPMAYAYGPKSGGIGHVVVVYGFIETDSSQTVLIRDPGPPCTGRTRAIGYQEYSNSATTDHWVTMYNLTKTP